MNYGPEYDSWEPRANLGAEPATYPWTDEGRLEEYKEAKIIAVKAEKEKVKVVKETGRPVAAEKEKVVKASTAKGLGASKKKKAV